MADPTPTPVPSKPEHLEPSELGKKEYWDALYSIEISNHTSNPSDIGTVWFDDSDAEAKMVSFLNRQAAGGGSFSSLATPLDKTKTSFLDLGTGNGSLLHALRRSGWSGPCLGVDYSPQAVELARRIAGASLPEDGEDDDEEEQEEEGRRSPGAKTRRSRKSRETISFLHWDVLGGPLLEEGEGDDSDTALTTTVMRAGSWDIVLDKGTFDAACLSAEKGPDGRRACEHYRSRVLKLLRPGDGGVFLITSCNWTERELRAWFAGGGDGEEDGSGCGNGDGDRKTARFEFVGQVEYRSFSFGGVKGQTISTVCFVKKES